MKDWLKYVYDNYSRASGFNEYWYTFENYLDANIPHDRNADDNLRKRLERFEEQIRVDSTHEAFLRSVYSVSAVRELAELQPRVFRETTRRTDAHDAFASDYSRFARVQKPKEPMQRILNLLYTVRCNSQHGQKILPEEWEQMRKRNELIFSLVIPILAKIDELMVTFYAASGIFAYGSLQGLERSERFGGSIERLDEVKIRGHLYELGQFPGWRYQSWGFVHGCLLQAPLASRLDFLQFCDEIEGEVFQRRLVLAYDDNNEPKHIAWAYHYRDEPQSSGRIMDGIWRGSNKGRN